MAWVTLVLAGLCEIGWAIGLKYSHGFTRPGPSAVTVVMVLVSLALLGQSLRALPIGTAYAVWTGIGTVGTAVVGMLLFGESRDWGRLLCILLIVTGTAGLKILSRP